MITMHMTHTYTRMLSETTLNKMLLCLTEGVPTLDRILYHYTSRTCSCSCSYHRWVYKRSFEPKLPLYYQDKQLPQFLAAVSDSSKHTHHRSDILDPYLKA